MTDRPQEFLEVEPTSVDWPRLLDLAAKRRQKVYRVNPDSGLLEHIPEPPERKTA